jgi:hypothetical protein
MEGVMGLFQADFADGVAFLLADKIGIDLSCGNILMCQHLRDRINVSSRSYLQGSIGMAKPVKRDWLGDTGLF